jgi:hypothetical protein
MQPKQSPFTPEQEQEALGLFKQGLNSSDVMRHFGATAMQKKPSWKMEQESLTKQRNNTAVLSDIPNDIGTGLRQLGEGYQERYGRLRESADALTRGEQSIGETGVQFGANIAGGLFADTTYQLARTGASFGMSQQQEDQFAESFGNAVTKVDESAGISDWYSGLSPRAQRNVNAALDILDVAPVPVLDKVKGLFGKGKPGTQVDSQAVLQEAYSRAARGESSSDAARVVNNSVDDAAREKLVTDLSSAYNDSLVGDLKTYNRKLQEQAQGMSRGGEIVTQDDLVRALANEGIVPDIRGKLADFTAEIRRIEERQNKLFEQYQPILDASPATANINDFRDFAKRSLVGRRSMAAELDQAEARLDTAIDNIARSLGVDETGMLTAKQIDEMSRIANDRTGAYRDTDVFQADVFSELGRASRLWLEENVPDNAFREVNDEWMRLNNVKETAGNLQNAQIDVGLLGRAIGSYVTTVGATALAAPTGNPAIALIAGMLTKMGGDEVANWMRSRKFSPEVRDVLQKNVLENDAALLDRLKQSATNQDNKNFYDALSRQLPPARPGSPRSEVSGGAPIAAGGETPTGRVEPGITERTQEGAVRQPEGERTPTELEGALAREAAEIEAELENLPEPDKQKLLGSGVDIQELSILLAVGGGGYWLMGQMDSEGNLLPAGAVLMAAGISRGTKLKVIDGAIKANDKARDAIAASGKSPKSPEMRWNEARNKKLLAEKKKVEDSLSPGLGIKDVSSNQPGVRGVTDGMKNETIVNIGLDVPGGGSITPNEVNAVLNKYGVEAVEVNIKKSDTEDTFVASLSRPLTPKEADAVSRELKQEAIVQRVDGEGALYGPEKEKWGDFAPEYFLDLDKRTGAQNAEFFTGKAAKASSDVPYKAVIETPQVQEKTRQAFDKFTMGGNFTGHIAKMIPAFAEKQMAVTDAIAKSSARSFLDIGASEGGVVKTVSAVNPNIKSVALDPNPQMYANYLKTPDVKNTDYKIEALGGSWTEDVPEGARGVFNGAETFEIKEFKPTQKFDVVNEDYAFQFINNDRSGQVAMVKDMMSKDGVFITSEKFKTTNDKFFEQRKLDHQRKYFDEDQLTEDKQTIVTGMADDMVTDTKYEQVLSDNFNYVVEYWNSGNFKGYMASDSKAKITEFVNNTGDVNSEFSAVRTPRVVKGDLSFNQSATTKTTGRQDLPRDSRGNQVGMSTQDRGAFGKGEQEVFNNFPDLTVKHLSALEGKGTVNKQFILDTANRPELKQPERDLIRAVVDEFPDGKINVQEYADKIKARLLPLTAESMKRAPNESGGLRYESVNLPDELRGNVARYDEKLYESPIANSAGSVHFDHLGLGEGDNYFAHTRIEDMGILRPDELGYRDNVQAYGDMLKAQGYSLEEIKKAIKIEKENRHIRRVIEIQSDLFQKGRLESEGNVMGTRNARGLSEEETLAQIGKERAMRADELAPLQPYRNTWWERIVREEVRSAAQDGKTKLQFPTGETAMKIEGLGENNTWTFVGSRTPLKKEDLFVGDEIENGQGEWIITEVLDDGKFKAVPKDTIQGMEADLEPLGYTSPDDIDFSDSRVLEAIDQQYAGTEQFDISGKVDTNNPIYKFYEKDVQKYLIKNYNAKRVTDENGVTWVEFDVDKSKAKLPVEAFGVVAAVGGATYLNNQE